MHGKTIIQAVIWILIGLLCVLSVLLLREYYFYRAQSAQLVELKDAYRQQINEIEKLKQDRKFKEEMLVSDDASDKKKSSDEEELTATEFPLGVRVVSSDDEPLDDQGTFLILKRDADYLRQSAVDYLREQRCDCAIYDDEYPLAQVRGEKPKPSGRTKKSRKNSARRHMSHASVQSEASDQASDHGGAHERVLSWPIEGRGKHFWLSSLYGPRRKPNGAWTLHGGIDMAAVRGTPVHAAAAGIVREARYEAGYGKTIVIEHNNKYKTRYAHLDAILVSAGQQVTKQTIIGRVGRTGNVRSRWGDPSHLHFEVYAYGKKINPLYVLGA